MPKTIKLQALIFSLFIFISVVFLSFLAFNYQTVFAKISSPIATSFFNKTPKKPLAFLPVVKNNNSFNQVTPKQASYVTVNQDLPITEQALKDTVRANPSLIDGLSYISPVSISTGSNFTMYYRVYNPTSNYVRIGLGASIISSSGSTVNDTYTSDYWCTIPAGATTWCSRSFVTSSSIIAGTYDVVFALWSDIPGSSTWYDSEQNNDILTIVRVNHTPALSYVSVSPSSGTTSNTYIFEATYQDQDGEWPSYIKIKIDGGSAQNMTYVSGNPTNNGSVIYRYSTNSLSVGSHNYEITTSDGYASISSGSKSGPIVNAPFQNPTLDISNSSISTSPVTAGSSFTMNYKINNPNSYSINVGLGGGIALTGTSNWINDTTTNDYNRTLSSGQNTVTRTFVIPASTAPGNYDVAFGVWPGTPGNGSSYSSGTRSNILSVKIQNPSLSILYADTKIDPTTIGENGSVTAYYTVNNPNPYSVNVGLGATLKRVGTALEIYDTPNDKIISIPSGWSVQSRTFKLSSLVLAGSYEYNLVIWSGAPGTTTQYASTGYRTGLVVTAPFQTPTFDLANSSISSSSVTAGGSFTMSYKINNPNSYNVTVNLGATIAPTGTINWINDTVTNDFTRTLLPGQNTVSRTFVVPTSTVTGSYDVIFGVWSGTIGSSTRYGEGTKSGALSSIIVVDQVKTTDENGNDKTVFAPGDKIGFHIYTNHGQNPITVKYEVFDQNNNIVSSLSKTETINSQPSQTHFNWVPTIPANLSSGTYKFRSTVGTSYKEMNFEVRDSFKILSTKIQDLSGIEQSNTISVETVQDKKIVVTTNQPAVVSWNGKNFTDLENNTYSLELTREDLNWGEWENAASGFTNNLTIQAVAAGITVSSSLSIIGRAILPMDASAIGADSLNMVLGRAVWTADNLASDVVIGLDNGFTAMSTGKGIGKWWPIHEFITPGGSKGVVFARLQKQGNAWRNELMTLYDDTLVHRSIWSGEGGVGFHDRINRPGYLKKLSNTEEVKNWLNELDKVPYKNIKASDIMSVEFLEEGSLESRVALVSRETEMTPRLLKTTNQNYIYLTPEAAKEGLKNLVKNSADGKPLSIKIFSKSISSAEENVILKQIKQAQLNNKWGKIVKIGGGVVIVGTYAWDVYDILNSAELGKWDKVQQITETTAGTASGLLISEAAMSAAAPYVASGSIACNAIAPVCFFFGEAIVGGVAWWGGDQLGRAGANVVWQMTAENMPLEWSNFDPELKTYLMQHQVVSESDDQHNVYQITDSNGDNHKIEKWFVKDGPAAYRVDYNHNSDPIYNGALDVPIVKINESRFYAQDYKGLWNKYEKSNSTIKSKLENPPTYSTITHLKGYSDISNIDIAPGIPIYGLLNVTNYQNSAKTIIIDPNLDNLPNGWQANLTQQLIPLEAREWALYGVQVTASNNRSIEKNNFAIPIEARYVGDQNPVQTLNLVFTLDTQAPLSAVDIPTGNYATAKMVTLFSDDPIAKIYYTLDGTEPTTSSALYTGQLDINVNTTLKYFAIDPAGNKSQTKTEVYQVPTFTLNLTRGWNMISVPLEFSDLTRLRSNPIVWRYDNNLGQYVWVSDKLMPGEGYLTWVDEAKTILLPRMPFTSGHYTAKDFSAGWILASSLWLEHANDLVITTDNQTYTLNQAINNGIISSQAFSLDYDHYDLINLLTADLGLLNGQSMWLYSTKPIIFSFGPIERTPLNSQNITNSNPNILPQIPGFQ